MASFEPVTAKDFDINDAIPLKQVDVQFAKTSSLITRASRYIPHKEDWQCITFGGMMCFHYPLDSPKHVGENTWLWLGISSWQQHLKTHLISKTVTCVSLSPAHLLFNLDS